MIDFTLHNYLNATINLTIIPNDSAIRLGMGAGGLISQHIEPDENDPRIWDVANSKMLNIQIINSNDFYLITGSPPPPTPVDAQTYRARKIPFLSDYTEATFKQSRRISLTGAVGEAVDVAKRAPSKSRSSSSLSDSGHSSEAIIANSENAQAHSETHEINLRDQRPETRVAMMDVDDTVPRFKRWATLN